MITDFLIEHITFVIIIIATIFLVGIFLFFLFRKRPSKESLPIGENEPRTSRSDQVETITTKKNHSQGEVEDFGLHLVLDTGQVIMLELPSTLGRSEDNSVVIKDDSVSTHHARIYYDNYIGAICVEDMGSQNGVFVDGRPTAKNVLDDGIRLTLGSINLIFRDTGYLPPLKSSGDNSHG